MNTIIYPETVTQTRLQRLESVVNELSEYTVAFTIKITVTAEYVTVRFIDSTDNIREFTMEKDVLKAKIMEKKREFAQRAIAHIEAKYYAEVVDIKVAGNEIIAEIEESNGFIRTITMTATIDELRKPTNKERLAQAQSISKEERIIRNLEQMRLAKVTLASRRPSIYLRSA